MLCIRVMVCQQFQKERGNKHMKPIVIKKGTYGVKKKGMFCCIAAPTARN